MGILEIAKVCCDRLGLLAGFHRLVNRNALTIVMFHRVLPTKDMGKADPAYTISVDLFIQCLAFFRRHYTIISFDDLLAAQNDQTNLPKRSLLITFDDGWDDTLEFATPLLNASAIPALVFVATDAMTDRQTWWWQEVLLAALRHGKARYRSLWRAVPSDAIIPPDREHFLRLLLRYGACTPEIRQTVLSPFATDNDGRHILAPDRLKTLARSGINVGSHGACHLPLSMLDDPGADIMRSRQTLADYLPDHTCTALSFPHGRYSPPVVAAAFSAGFKFLFTSDPILNIPGNGRMSRVLGRIEICAHQIADRHGRAQNHRLATWMFLRPRQTLPSGSAVAEARSS